MLTKDSARAALRAATAPCHDRVDALFSRADLTDRSGYARFLTAQAVAHIGAEAALTRAGAGDVLPDWPERQRAAAICADLAELGLPVPPPAAPPPFDGEAAVLGGVYVLEGSRLGGRVLKASVPPSLPTRFLGAGEPRAWRRLLELLEERLVTPEARAAAIRAAEDVFALFETSGRRLVAT